MFLCTPLGITGGGDVVFTELQSQLACNVRKEQGIMTFAGLELHEIYRVRVLERVIRSNVDARS